MMTPSQIKLDGLDGKTFWPTFSKICVKIVKVSILLETAVVETYGNLTDIATVLNATYVGPNFSGVARGEGSNPRTESPWLQHRHQSQNAL